MYEIMLSVLVDLWNSFESLMKHVLYLNGDMHTSLYSRFSPRFSSLFLQGRRKEEPEIESTSHTKVFFVVVFFFVAEF